MLGTLCGEDVAEEMKGAPRMRTQCPMHMRGRRALGSARMHAPRLQIESVIALACRQSDAECTPPANPGTHLATGRPHTTTGATAGAATGRGAPVGWGRWGWRGESGLPALDTPLADTGLPRALRSDSPCELLWSEKGRVPRTQRGWLPAIQGPR